MFHHLHESLHHLIHTLVHNLSSAGWMSVIIAFMIGFLHEFDPIHNRWMLLAAAVAVGRKQRQYWLFAVTVGILHFFTNLIIVLFVKGLVSHGGAGGIEKVDIKILSGIFLIMLSLYIIFHKHEHHYDSGGEKSGKHKASHESDKRDKNGPLTTKETFLSALAVGITPCPLTVLILSTASTLMNWLQTVLVVFFFHLGLTSAVLMFTYIMARVGRPFFEKHTAKARLISAILILIWGVVLILRSKLLG